MGNCDIALEWISASLDGALTIEEQSALDAHLAECAACSALYTELCGLHAAAAELEELPAPAGFARAVMAAIAAESTQDKSDNVIPFAAKRKTRTPWRHWAATAAAVAIVVLGAVSIPSLSGNMEVKRDAAAPEAVAPQEAETADITDSAEFHYSFAADCVTSESESVTEETTESTNGRVTEPCSPAESPAAKQEYSDGALNAPLCDAQTCCGVLTLTADLVPEGLEQHESTVNPDGTVTYTVPADYFFSVLKTLENGSRTDYQFTAGQTDAEQGIILVTDAGK